MSERRVEIVRLVQSGMSGAAVGATLGVTREWVRQVWTRETGTPLPTRERWRAARAARRRWCRSCHADYHCPRAEHCRTGSHVRSKSVNAERRYERRKAWGRAAYHRLHPDARYYRLRATP